MALSLPGRIPDAFGGPPLEAIQQSDTPPPTPIAAAIVADRAVTAQAETLSRVLPGTMVRAAADTTRDTVRGLTTALHMPDPEGEGQVLDTTLGLLQDLYATQEEMAGTQPTEVTDATADNPLLQINTTIKVVKELKADLPLYASRRVPRATLGSRLVVRAALALQARRAPDEVSRVEAADVLANGSLRGVWPRSRTFVALGMVTRLLR